MTLPKLSKSLSHFVVSVERHRGLVKSGGHYRRSDRQRRDRNASPVLQTPQLSIETAVIKIGKALVLGPLGTISGPHKTQLGMERPPRGAKSEN